MLKITSPLKLQRQMQWKFTGSLLAWPSPKHITNVFRCMEGYKVQLE